ncbi:chymotrypsin-like protease CTRL-1 [Maniola jurtina]|uniref:chymotrypsin-like protease CTRL-1 n=1 Tax=Maniola jurtina TaxID=191418 RepID=UPI001E686635|nr:chymotrypsin-like protease CTRL-1 [Maniola jurtina]
MFSKLFVIWFVIFLATCEPDKRVITTLKYSKYYVKPTVVNGEPAATGQVPYLVSIKEPILRIGDQRIVWKNLCGGSIIAQNKVLTAAHCFESQDFYYKKNPSILRIVAGNLRTDITHSGDTETNIINQWRKINRVILHNNFNFPLNDIALVFLNAPLKFTNNVDFVITASKNTDYTHTCMTAGFGRIGHNSKSRISPILLIARINTLSKWKCSMIWEMNMNSFICSDSSISDVSRGDSGGPLVCKGTLDPKEKPNRDLLVGVVSGKNFDKTTIFTRVSAYKDWIARSGDKTVLFECNFLITLLQYSTN